MKVNWTDHVTQTMLNMLNEDQNISYKEVAKIMTGMFDMPFTKNSCIGKARKLGVPPRGPITIYQLRDGVCHWPLSNVEDHPPYVYCGKPTIELGCSWCQEHADMAHGKATSGNAKIAHPKW